MSHVKEKKLHNFNETILITLSSYYNTDLSLGNNTGDRDNLLKQNFLQFIYTSIYDLQYFIKDYKIVNNHPK